MSAALNLPPLLARLGRRVPGPFVSLHFAAGLELARRLKWLEPPAELDGRSFAITVEDGVSRLHLLMQLMSFSVQFLEFRY